MKISKIFLQKFEEDIVKLFNKGKIKSPIHLSNGNEDELIKIFKKKKISINDWICCSWRSHYQCLLKGVSPIKLKKSILNGKSISLCFLDKKIYSSAIVGGSIPVAVGLAMSLKLKKSKSRVFCFVGDMTAETSIMHECYKFSKNHNLPIHFIVEDNNLSVCSPTKKIWNLQRSSFKKNNKFISYFKYINKFPHAGAGIRVQF
jgi:pyruvate dehydrogenase E1 component alpha subunit